MAYGLKACSCHPLSGTLELEVDQYQLSWVKRNLDMYDYDFEMFQMIFFFQKIVACKDIPRFTDKTSNFNLSGKW